MTHRFSRATCLLAVAATFAALAFSGSVRAAEIGINFQGAGTAVTGTAGVVAQGNFNNVTAQAGTLSNAIDSTGTGTTLDVAYESNELVLQKSHGGSDAGFLALFSNQILSQYSCPYGATFASPGGTNRVTATLTNIPYAVYDVYIYVDNKPGSVFESTDSSTLIVDGVKESYTSSTTSSTYQVGVNYVEFTGLTGATQYFVDSTTINPVSGGSDSSFNSGFAGIQIVDASPVPEPASLGLLAVGAMALLKRRRKH